MPELPEVQAHAERLTAEFGGATLAKFTPIAFHALKTVVPPPEAASASRSRGGPAGQVPAARLRHRHLRRAPDAGRAAKPEPKQTARPKGGLARWTFDDGRALLLTEAGQRAPRRRVGLGHRRRAGPAAPRRPRPRGDGRSRRGAGRALRRPRRCGCTRSCATRAASPASGGGWPTRCATGPSSRRSRRPRSSGSTAPTAVVAAIHEARRRGPGLRADPARHERVGRPARRRPPPRRRAVPGVRRHRARGDVRAVHRSTTAPRARPAARCWPTTPPASSSSRPNGLPWRPTGVIW